MKFSIIIPSFEQGKFIKEAIDSIFAQKTVDIDIEIIVMDGGSKDNTLEILKSYGDKIFWVSEKDNGQTDAINKGLRMAKGDIIAYLNSDDYYLPGAFKKVKEFFINNPLAKCVTGDALIVDENGKEIQKFVRFYKKILGVLNIKKLLYVTNYIIQPSTFLRRELIEEIGFFDETKKYTMDYDYWLRIIKKYRIFYINYPLSTFRIHSSSKGGSQYEAQFDEDLLTLENHCKNKFFIFIHKLHNFFIKLIYRMIK